MKKSTLLTAVALEVATVMTTGLVVIPDPVQGSDTSTDTDNPCAGNAISQPPSTEDSEEVDSDTECEFYGSGDIEGGGVYFSFFNNKFCPKVYLTMVHASPIPIREI